MRKLFFALALMLVGTLTFANEKTNESVIKDDLQFTDLYASVETIDYELYGLCTALMFNFDDEGNLVGIYNFTWESSLSDIEGGCALDARILEFAMNTGNYFN
tara:strand:- start:28 stop:336 length:309 start_codon:yes stop_codon:yes gene_type:complete